MAKMKAWIHAARLRTLPLSMSGIIVGSAIAYQDNIYRTSILLLAILTTLLFQILSNFANDLGDTLKGADNENRVGPERAIQSGAITIPQMKFVIIILSILSLLSATWLIYEASHGKSWTFWVFYLLLAVFCIIAAITYTMGKKAYGYYGFGDVFVFIFFGLVSVVGVYHLFPDNISIATIEWKMALPALSIGALSTAVLNLNNMRDRINDEKVGKNTLVVNLGLSKAKIYHYLLVKTGIISMMIYIFLFCANSFIFLILIIPIFLLLRHLSQVKKITEEHKFDPHLKVVALSTFLMSLLFFLSIFISHASF